MDKDGYCHGRSRSYDSPRRIYLSCLPILKNKIIPTLARTEGAAMCKRNLIFGYDGVKLPKHGGKGWDTKIPKARAEGIIPSLPMLSNSQKSTFPSITNMF
jgi:hypothetical protein